MIVKDKQGTSVRRGRRRAHRASAFSLVELLTVVFIISLLIGILIPSINAARTAAKKVATKKTIDAIKVGLELFKNDNGKDFRQTNGYPPSFAHPRIPGYEFNPHLGEFPFIPEDSDTAPDAPLVYGAHWLPAMLMGVDKLGYVKRSNVPNTEDNLRAKPWRWYLPDPLGKGAEGRPLERMDLYLNPDDVSLLRTDRLAGRPPALDDSSSNFFHNWEEMKQLPVIADNFDQPILYYVASTHGNAQNMVSDARSENGEYDSGVQEQGIPYYFHQDNEGFTGTEGVEGWDFGSPQEHTIAKSGAALGPAAIVGDAGKDTFARYVIDRSIYLSLAHDIGEGHLSDANVPLRPVNADSFLLISAGPDGRFGTSDDVSNLPRWPDS
ncbi:MAG: hypothetical protein PVI86_01390 [Phycisphaerae bacterium]|jgi:competence protein ComGC